MTLFLETNIYLFFGRFHSLLVHLPIGFIILAVVFEGISWKKKIDFDIAIQYALVLGASFGTLAIILGLMLASDGGYNEDTLAIHKWTGISMTVLCFVAYFLKKKGKEKGKLKNMYAVVLSLVVILISIAGHYGGNLTHGATYLFEYAPLSVRTMAGLKPARKRITVLDSAMVYEDVIHPIFEAKCNVCHNNDKAKGELRLIDAETILKGGENGVVIVAGNTSESDLFRRVMLDPNHDDFMPTEGRTPLSKEEALLLKWWIEEGASFDKKIIDLKLTDRIKVYLEGVGIGVKKSFLESLNIAKIEKEIINRVVAEGFKIKRISNNSNMLEVTYSIYNKEKLNKEKLDVLLEAKKHIAWLNLSGIPLNDNWISQIIQLENLTELRLNNTKIKDAALEKMTALKNLEYLNIYDNQLSDKSVKSIQKMSKLKKLYVWKTNLSKEGVANIQATIPGILIISGI